MMRNRWFRSRHNAQTNTYTSHAWPLLALGALTAACAVGTPDRLLAPAPPPPPPPAEHVPPPVPEETVKKPEDLGVKILSGVGFQTPESVAYDAEQDVYFVSNINGAPTDVDDNGFLSKVTPDGEVTLKFIDGAADKVTLNAPKGIALNAGVLYVADIDRVRLFDAKSGEAKGEVVMKGATFLNDLAIAKDGSIYVTDTGLNPDFSSSGTDAVYKITGGKAKKLLASKKLAGPNGILADEGGAWIVTFGSGELSFISDKGKQEKIQKLSMGQNDGLVKTATGQLLISSWEGSTVLAGSAGGTFTDLVSGVETPADIGYDVKRNRLLIPLFKKDSVIFHDLKDAPKTAEPTAKEPSGPPTLAPSSKK